MWSDTVLSQWVLENVSQNTFIAQIAKYLSEFTSWGQLWIIIMLALIGYDYIKHKKINVYYLISMVVVLIGWCFFDKYIKNVVARERPFESIEGFKSVMDSVNYAYPSDYSFPSGHSLIAFASAYIISHREKKYLPYCYILATLIALSRIILGAHYLSDVLAGAGIGTVFGVLGCLLSDFIYSKIETKLTLDPKDKKHAA